MADTKPTPDTLSSAHPLARRVTNYATNLLATGLILIVGVVFGIQVIQWWRADRQTIKPADHVREVVGSDLGDPWAAGWLEFGDSALALRRTVVKGKQDDALARLRRDCRNAANAGRSLEREPGQAERRLLEKIAGQTPIEQVAHRWSMYELNAPLPMVVVRDDSIDRHRQSTEVAGSRNRVISWGLAFPGMTQSASSETEWLLFVAADTSPGTNHHAWNPPPAPAGARRLLSLRSEDGSGLCSWSGRGEPELWKQFLNRWHEAEGWAADGVWYQLEATWHRRFQHSSGRFADVQFSMASDGTLTGFWIATLPTSKATKESSPSIKPDLEQ